MTKGPPTARPSTKGCKMLMSRALIPDGAGDGGGGGGGGGGDGRRLRHHIK